MRGSMGKRPSASPPVSWAKRRSASHFTVTTVKRQFDGIRVNDLEGSGRVAMSWICPSSMRRSMEMVVTGGLSAEHASSGMLFNVIPNDGSKIFRCVGSGTFRHDNLQGDGFTDALRQCGPTNASLNPVPDDTWVLELLTGFQLCRLRSRLVWQSKTRATGILNCLLD
jgi:hypothetical protein